MVVKQRLISWVEMVKPYIQYTISLLLVINAIGLFTYSIGSGGLMLLAGLLTAPKIQDMLEQHTEFELRPLVLAGAIGALFFGSSVLLLGAVDLAQAPDFLIPFDR